VSVFANGIDVVRDDIRSIRWDAMRLCFVHLIAYRLAIPRPWVPVARPLDQSMIDFVELTYGYGIRTTNEVLEELRKL